MAIAGRKLGQTAAMGANQAHSEDVLGEAAIVGLLTDQLMVREEREARLIAMFSGGPGTANRLRILLTADEEDERGILECVQIIQRAEHEHLRRHGLGHTLPELWAAQHGALKGWLDERTLRNEKTAVAAAV